MALRYKHSKSTELRAEAVGRVMRWVLALLMDEETTTVSISDNECGHAACGGNDTVILLMRAGEPITGLRIAKRLEVVTEADVAAAFQSALLPVRGSRIR